MSKLERWKKISSTSSVSEGNPNSKLQIIEELSSVEVLDTPAASDDAKASSEENTNTETNNSKAEDNNKTPISEDIAESKVESTNDNDNKESVIENKNNKDKDETGVENKSINSTSNKTRNTNKPKSKQKPEPQPEPSKPEQQERFTERVNNAVISYREAKLTKKDTHKKTSYEITFDNLVKLENFSRVHGHGAKGEFINHLLETAFEELEENEAWKEILHRDYSAILNTLKTGRRYT